MFELKTIDDLREAPYNPREITQRNLESLKVSLDEFGDLSGIVWNKRTGHIVCGHQRLKALRDRYSDLTIGLMNDNETMALYSREDGDGVTFSIRVVDWDEIKEKAANIAANSQTVQGTFTQEVQTIASEIMENLPDIFDKLNFAEIRGLDVEEIEQEANGAGTLVPAMELQPYEHYDYVLVLAKNTQDWEWLCEKLNLKRVNASPIAGKKKIGLGRAIDVTKLRSLVEGR